MSPVSVDHYRRGRVLGRRLRDGLRLPADGARQEGLQAGGGRQESGVTLSIVIHFIYFYKA